MRRSSFFTAVKESFAAGAQRPFAIDFTTAPLRDVEQVWTAAEHGSRVVFVL